MPQAVRRHQLPDDANLPGGPAIPVHQGIPIHHHDALYNNNLTLAGKQAAPRKSPPVAQNWPPNAHRENFAAVSSPVINGAVYQGFPPYFSVGGSQAMVRLAPGSNVYIPLAQVPYFGTIPASPLENITRHGQSPFLPTSHQPPRRDAREWNAFEVNGSTPRGFSASLSDLENRKERNRLRAMIFGQPLVEAQALKLSQVVAIDCEMVGVGPPIGHKTRNGKRDPIRHSALARVSIVDFHGHIVLDAYVKPREKVTDFRTSVSGIRPSDLVGENAIPFENARALVSKVLNGRIVVGHDIRNDLRILKLERSLDPGSIRDTQGCPEVKEKYGPSKIGLKKLCQHEFGVDVQPDEHSSVTDARATMALYHIFHGRWEQDLRWAQSGF